MTNAELCNLEKPELVKLIDEGKLIYLPCKVGDEIYTIGKLTEEIFELTVVGFAYVQGRLTIMTDNGMMLSKFYFTREEAEQKLKELTK